MELIKTGLFTNSSLSPLICCAQTDIERSLFTELTITLISFYFQIGESQ
jgi:hypothetical protein